MADEVHIHFPWGSLLRAVATGDPILLHNIRHICATGAHLEVVLGLDPTRDQTEIIGLGLDALTPEFITETLIPRYEDCGCTVLESGILPPTTWPDLQTSWAKRLRGGAGRVLTYLIAEAVE